MKNRIIKYVLLVLAVLIAIVSEFVFNQKLSFIDLIFLFTLFSLLDILYHIQNDIKYLKSANKYQYEEQVNHNELITKLIASLRHEITVDNIHKKAVDDFQHGLDILEEVAEKRDSLKSQARTEESDSKALKLEAKAKREDKLRAVLESGLIARLGLYYEVRWDDKQVCLRIQDFDMTKNIAVFYPKSNKLNFKGNWTSNAADYLEKHLKELSNEK